MREADFDLKALYDALDAKRREKGLSWSAAAVEINRFSTRPRSIAATTITSLRQKPVGEGDGILQMLVWLGRTPESFVPGMEMADEDDCRLPELPKGQILRWDTKALFKALDARRNARGIAWIEVGREVGATPGMLRYLARGGRIGFPGVMRLTRWIGRPAVTFTRISDR
jgi:hypothetical protein